MTLFYLFSKIDLLHDLLLFFKVIRNIFQQHIIENNSKSKLSTSK
jgi:hypothetical protein